ncbi:c-type cytochrome [Dokdonella soli]|uniref:C-type cytochrome n=1 Tax=Dokdonella soli TaxID=529810 RepID=A0ABP3TQ74_9GAMM
MTSATRCLSVCLRAGVLLLCADSAALHATDWIDLRGATPVHGDAAAGASKATVCVACHGPNGNAIVPAFPRLAGQHADYLYWELVNFKRGTRPQSPMTAQAANLSEADMRDLAAYFAAQAPTADAAPASPSDRGEVLFHNGDPARGIPPCQGCHGSDASGIVDARFGSWPSLRGQHADYVVARLRDYRDGKLTDSSNDFVMRGVAGTLDDESIAALAAWVASLPPTAAH